MLLVELKEIDSLEDTKEVVWKFISVEVDKIYEIFTMFEVDGA